MFAVAFALAGCTTPASAEPPPHHAEIAKWAVGADVKLSPYRNCKGIEEQHFGSMGSVCWSAKARREQPPKGSRMFPRFEITLAVYADEAKAKARMARFRDVPKPLDGEAGKTYPLRAGFRLGTRVVIVTTDAFAFEGEAYRAATGLAKATGGTELTCWTKCP